VNGIRCGRCIAQDHASCVGTIRMGPTKATYVWHCDCSCHGDVPAGSLRPVTAVHPLR
jgi:hypothetical protein